MKRHWSFLDFARRHFGILLILGIGVTVIVGGLLISNHTAELMSFSGNQSPVFWISGSSKDYFLEPVSQANVNLCTDPTNVSLYRQNETTPVYAGHVTYYLTRSGSGSNGGYQVNWNSMFLPDGLSAGNYYFVVQEPSCRPSVTLALFRIVH